MFRRLLYAESPPKNLDVSMTKALAYYKLGGAFDTKFCHYIDFIRREFPETRRATVSLKGNLKRRLDAVGVGLIEDGRLIHDLFEENSLFHSYQVVGISLGNVDLD